MELYSADEYVDMLLIYGECRKNSREAAALYRERYPQRRHPGHCMFVRIEQKLRQDCTLPSKKKVHNSKPVTNEDNAVVIIGYTSLHPQTSVRDIARQSGISKSSVHRILKGNRLHPYKLHLVQGLRPTDPERRLEFLADIAVRISDDNLFLSKILWSDESRFHNNGVVNRHNSHYWADENPHWVRESRHQRVWGVNVWCGLLDDRLIGPYFYQNSLTAAQYLEQMSEYLEDIPLLNRLQVYFQQDGAPAHNAGVVKTYLDTEFPQRWMGTHGPIRWPPRSPDLTPLDFFLWGHLKSVVYDTEPQNLQDLQNRIVEACRSIRPETIRTVTSKNLRDRFEKCIEAGGRQFEHL